MKNYGVVNIPPNSMLKIRSQAKECCYRDGTGCALCGCCVVGQDETIIECNWFMNGVLPANEELFNAVMKYNNVKTANYKKTCKECGHKFTSESKTSTYCPACSKKRELARKRAYKQRQAK